MTIGVIGLGHVGLPTALLLAYNQSVIGIDTDPHLVEDLNEGKLPIDETGIHDLYEEVQDQFVVSSVDDAVSDSQLKQAEAYVIATPTPLNERTNIADLQYIRAAAKTLIDMLEQGNIVILESTVPPGTAEQVLLPLLEESGVQAGKFQYAYSPERAMPGRTVYEMRHNDRVIGGIDAESCSRAKQLYQFVAGDIYTTDVVTAELVKLLENTYRDVNIALANEVATLAENYEVDGRKAIELANNHPRVDILSPGPGVGGHCIPIDPQFLSQMMHNHQLISVARRLNDQMPIHILQLVREVIESESNPRVAVLGVAYKGDVDDTRNTPALRFLQLAENEGYRIRVHDPHVGEFEYELQSLRDATADADCLVILTDHAAYTDLDAEWLATRMRNKCVVDTRGILNVETWEEYGFTVRRLGDGSL